MYAQTEFPSPVFHVATVMLAGGSFFAGSQIAGDESPNTVVAVRAEGALAAAGRVVMINGGRKGAIMRVHGLQNPGRGKVYQVWIARDGTVEPSSLFSVDKNGRATTALVDDLTDAQALLVTAEPAGGSSAPTGEVAIKADIS